MSARKRRLARRVAQLVRMDAQYYLAQAQHYRQRDPRYILVSMQAMGGTMNARSKERAVLAINARRVAMNRQVLS